MSQRLVPAIALLTLAVAPSLALATTGDGDEGQEQGPPARVTTRNVLGINAHLLVDASAPRLGDVWEVTLDCSGTGRGVAVLAARTEPTYGVVVRAGEILIDVFRGRPILNLAVPHGGGPVRFSAMIPNDTSLLGYEVHVQGLCTGSPGPRLSNALVLSLGR